MIVSLTEEQIEDIKHMALWAIDDATEEFEKRIQAIMDDLDLAIKQNEADKRDNGFA